MSSNIYWQPELETMPRQQLEQLQLEKLRASVARAAKSPYYSQVFREAGLTPESIRTMDDIRRIPFTTKQDMRDNYPFGFLTQS
ncbi:MAG: hypothetical protein J6S21_00365, partial [Victivallales bacterium]|nr:hypothetical protein [Victivallales bacterium]